MGPRRVGRGEGELEAAHGAVRDEADLPTVSRHHAEVRRTGDGFEVVDLGSRNGTKVNGLGVTRQHLADGDDLLVGAVPLRFEAV